MPDYDIYGYPVDYGYRGRMPDGKWQLFATSVEYEEAVIDWYSTVNTEA